MTAGWTRPADLRTRVRRRWDDQTLLRAYARGEEFAAFDLPIRRPPVTEIGRDLGAVQRWAAELDAGRRGDRHYALTYATVGGRLIGRNELPDRAVVSSWVQAWALLGVAEVVRRFDEILAVTGVEPVVHRWVAHHPLQALELDLHWPTLLSAYRWLDDHRGSGLYLRQISAPGVHTKFVERHRVVLSALLAVPPSAAGFVRALGLAGKPEMLRLRASAGLDAFSGLTDVTAPSEQLRQLAVRPQATLIVENEVTFLSVPVPTDGVVIWGKGFEVDRSGALPWLVDRPVWYWGDLDTHGFAILHRLRAWLPQTRSVLMDRATLLAHRDRWITEDTPTTARLDRLGLAEAALYGELVADVHGDRVRLEQERVDWAWATSRLEFLQD